MISIERYDFYERAKQAYCVIQTGERRFYGCFAFRKGVVPPRRRITPWQQSRSSSSVYSSLTLPTAQQRQPRMGETLLGNGFKLGPGGKGSNQAVAAGRLGADVTFITRLGRDPFADMALATWKDAGVKPAVIETPESYTGAAYIFVDEQTGDNAIIVSPGAAMLIFASGHRSQCRSDRSAASS